MLRNCEFNRGNPQLKWIWPLAHFDYIHIRDLYDSIDNWFALYNMVCRPPKLSGWLKGLKLNIHAHSDVVTAEHMLY